MRCDKLQPRSDEIIPIFSEEKKGRGRPRQGGWCQPATYCAEGSETPRPRLQTRYRQAAGKRCPRGGGSGGSRPRLLCPRARGRGSHHIVFEGKAASSATASRVYLRVSLAVRFLWPKHPNPHGHTAHTRHERRLAAQQSHVTRRRTRAERRTTDLAHDSLSSLVRF